jgi:thioesterase domain-containing protein/acyl carrier protein
VASQPLSAGSITATGSLHDGGVTVTPTPLERALIRAWSDGLQVVVGIDDDFVELAGDSIRAARVFAVVQRHLGLERPASLLEDASTIASLARALDDDSDWESFLATQSRDKPPLFVVHDGAGSLAYASRLGAALGPEQPIYGVPSGIMDGGHTLRAASIDELATLYVERIRALHPKGPYLFYGVSAGGVIAMEIARQLKCAGTDVPLVVLGDTVAPVPGVAPPHLPPSLPKPRAVRRAARWLRGLSQLPARTRTRALLGLLKHQVLGRLTIALREARDRRRRDRDRRRQRRIFARALRQGEAIPAPARGFYALYKYGRLLLQHRPQPPFPDRVVLLRAGGLWTAPDRGWHALVGDRLEIVDVPGTHVALGDEASGAYVGPILAKEIAREWVRKD